MKREEDIIIQRDMELIINYMLEMVDIMNGELKCVQQD